MENNDSDDEEIIDDIIEGMDLVAAVDAAAPDDGDGGGDDGSDGDDDSDSDDSSSSSSDDGETIDDPNQLLEQLRNNDPELTCLCVTALAYSGDENPVDWGQIGREIGTNTHLTLVSFHHDTMTRDEYYALLEEMVKNESIRDLDFLRVNLYGGTVFPCLLPMMPRIRQLSVEECDVGDGVGGRFRLLSQALCVLDGASSSLEEINLDRIDVGEHEIIYAILELRGHANLEKISLRGCDIGENGCNALTDSVIYKEDGSRSRLLTLDLGENDITDIGIDALVTGMISGRSTVEHLNLEDTRIETEGWQSVARLLADPNSMLKCLSLNDNEISDEAMIDLAESLRNNVTLTDLHLNNTDISYRGLQALSVVLESPESRLRQLSLRGNRIKNKGAFLLADALGINTTLLRLDLDNDISIASNGWKAFSRLLCDKSSIVATLESNHTLQMLVNDEWTLSGELMSLLAMNREGSVREVARRKIIKSHFSGRDLDMQPFVDMPSGALPHVIAWMSSGGMSPLYLFVRNVQAFFDFSGGARASDGVAITLELGSISSIKSTSTPSSWKKRRCP